MTFEYEKRDAYAVNRLSYHVQLERELLLGQAFRFPECLDALVQHGGSILSPGFYATAMFSSDDPLL